MQIKDVIAAWNNQADDANSWDNLDADERVEFTIRFMMTSLKFLTNVDAYNFLSRECLAAINRAEEGGKPAMLESYDQHTQRGSFENETTYRRQLYPVMVEIQEPLNFTYLPKTVTVGMIEQYYAEELLNPVKAKNQKYNYGERLVVQLQTVMDILYKTPFTNQAVISISRPEDIFLPEPPCLRELAFSYFTGKLNLTSYWRSNDLSEAFLTNQGGLALLLRDVAEYAMLPVGSHFYMSPGAHVYIR